MNGGNASQTAPPPVVFCFRIYSRRPVPRPFFAPRLLLFRRGNVRAAVTAFSPRRGFRSRSRTNPPPFVVRAVARPCEWGFRSRFRCGVARQRRLWLPPIMARRGLSFPRPWWWLSPPRPPRVAWDRVKPRPRPPRAFAAANVVSLRVTRRPRCRVRFVRVRRPPPALPRLAFGVSFAVRPSVDNANAPAPARRPAVAPVGVAPRGAGVSAFGCVRLPARVACYR